jgi:hypothetical protein
MSEDAKANVDVAKKSKALRMAIIIAAAIPCVVGIIEIWKWATEASGPKIVGQATYSDYQLPEQFWGAADKLIDRLADADETYKRFDNKQLTDWKWADDYVSIVLANTGDLEASKVRVVLGDTGYAEIQWDDGKTDEVEYTNEIALGTLPLDKQVRIRVWPRSFYPYDGVAVVYDSGRIRVNIDNPNYKRSWWGSALGVGVMAALVPLLLIIAAHVGEIYVVGLRTKLAQSKEQRPQDDPAPGS